MAKIYWAPHKSRAREEAFVRHLTTHLGGELVLERFNLAPAALDCLLHKSEILACLEKDTLLSAVKRRRCIDEISSKLSAEIRIATDVSRVSFDAVIQQSGHTFYWEFHEKQHRGLTVDRPQAVYGANGEAYLVPRYVQRFLRDIWRIKAFPNLSIVWEDWFEKHRQAYKPCLDHGFHEYHLPEKFSFEEFCK